MELNAQLTALQTDLKSFVEKANAEQKTNGTVLAETKSAYEKLQAEVADLRNQTDAIDGKLAHKHNSGIETKSLADTLKENGSISHLLEAKSGKATITLPASAFEKKTVLTSSLVGAVTPGVLGAQVIPGVVAQARQTLYLRDLFTATRVSDSVVYFVKETTSPTMASVQIEGQLKQDNAIAFSVQSENIKTIATTLRTSKQVYDDFTTLASYLQNALPYAVNLAEENEMLTGDGSAGHLHGLLVQAQASTYTAPASGSTVLVSTKMQQVGLAMEQIQLSKEVAPNFICLSPVDWYSMRLSTTTYGSFIMGDPQQSVQPSLFGIPVIVTTSLATGHFLVGSSAANCAQIYDREDLTVSISTEDQDNFVRNMVTIRAEKRMALVTLRPNAFVSGTFN